MTKDDDWLDKLLKKADELEEKRVRTPIDVAVALADEAVTVRLKYLRRDDFEEFSSKHSQFGYRDARGCWFDLAAVAMNYPDVVLITDDGTDELYELRGKEAVYRWPSVYTALSETDRQSVQAAIWGVYVWEPEQRLKASKSKKAKAKEATNG